MARGHTMNFGAPVNRSNRMHRPAIMANHWLHWISSIIVMSIAAYFIARYSHNTHLVYWVTIASIDAFLYLPALFLPAISAYKGYMAPLAWMFSYLWLTAFIFASQDYKFGSCAVSPSGVNQCGIKKTLEAFAFIAFFTNIVGQYLEGKLWDIQRFKNRNAHPDKHVGSTSTAATAHGQQAPTATTAI